jgi:hypothetical protein
MTTSSTGCNQSLLLSGRNVKQERSKRKKKRSIIHPVRTSNLVIERRRRDPTLILTNHLLVEMIVKKIKKATTK